ncbi:sulfurtransferase [Sungkyunkwania multivorans]|uniref:Sulfurtransferase n=1 Tax=Sungkyunkwania multivorans TaxID=1173618 RepID=A0ABW3CZY5_9FLAO
MTWNNSYILIPLLLFSCKNDTIKQEAKDIPAVVLNNRPGNYVNDFHLIEAEELQRILDSDRIKIIDFRKREAYDKGHIEGAIHVYRSDIEDDSYPYKGMMATKETIERLFSKLGIRNDDTLVIYDDKGASDAARLWWVLQNYDFDAVRLLNGGLSTWRYQGGSLSVEVNAAVSSDFKLNDNPSLRYYINKEQLIDQVSANPETVLLDTRNRDEFSGKRRKKGAVRGGRIPNSVLIDWADAIDYHGTKKFKTFNALQKRYGTLGVPKSHPIITYCHSGVRSAHTTFVLTQLLGYENVKNYDGSWTEWSYFENLPFEQDSITTINE